MGEETKKFIKEVFGENFTKNLNVFEKKFKEVYSKNEKLNKELLDEVTYDKLSSRLIFIFLKQAKTNQLRKDINLLINLIFDIIDVIYSILFNFIKNLRFLHLINFLIIQNNY